MDFPATWEPKIEGFNETVAEAETEKKNTGQAAM